MSFAINALLEQKQRLIDEKEKLIERFDKEISEIDSAIELIRGNRTIERQVQPLYDDEHPDYIKSSQEEI